MEMGKLKVIPLGSGYAWFDTGTPDRLSDASDFVKAIELRQGIQIACLEEYAYYNGWIDESKVNQAIQKYKKTEYGKYLQRMLDKKGKQQYTEIFKSELFE